MLPSHRYPMRPGCPSAAPRAATEATQAEALVARVAAALVSVTPASPARLLPLPTLAAPGLFPAYAPPLTHNTPSTCKKESEHDAHGS